jgi:hypothetical protein
LLAVAAAPLANLGALARAREDWDSARPLYEQGIKIWRDMGAREFLGRGLISLAYVSHNVGDAIGAARVLSEALEIERESRATEFMPHLACTLAALLLEAGGAHAGAVALGGGERHQGALDQFERAEQDKSRQALIDALGEDSFEREYARCCAMTTNELFQFADARVGELLDMTK